MQKNHKFQLADTLKPPFYQSETSPNRRKTQKSKPKSFLRPQRSEPELAIEVTVNSKLNAPKIITSDTEVAADVRNGRNTFSSDRVQGVFCIVKDPAVRYDSQTSCTSTFPVFWFRQMPMQVLHLSNDTMGHHIDTQTIEERSDVSIRKDTSEKAPDKYPQARPSDDAEAHSANDDGDDVGRSIACFRYSPVTCYTNDSVQISSPTITADEPKERETLKGGISPLNSKLAEIQQDSIVLDKVRLSEPPEEKDPPKFLDLGPRSRNPSLELERINLTSDIQLADEPRLHSILRSVPSAEPKGSQVVEDCLRKIDHHLEDKSSEYIQQNIIARLKKIRSEKTKKMKEIKTKTKSERHMVTIHLDTTNADCDSAQLDILQKVVKSASLHSLPSLKASRGSTTRKSILKPESLQTKTVCDCPTQVSTQAKSILDMQMLESLLEEIKKINFDVLHDQLSAPQKLEQTDNPSGTSSEEEKDKCSEKECQTNRQVLKTILDLEKLEKLLEEISGLDLEKLAEKHAKKQSEDARVDEMNPNVNQAIDEGGKDKNIVETPECKPESSGALSIHCCQSPAEVSEFGLVAEDKYEPGSNTLADVINLQGESSVPLPKKVSSLTDFRTSKSVRNLNRSIDSKAVESVRSRSLKLDSVPDGWAPEKSSPACDTSQKRASGASLRTSTINKLSKVLKLEDVKEEIEGDPEVEPEGPSAPGSDKIDSLQTPVQGSRVENDDWKIAPVELIANPPQLEEAVRKKSSLARTSTSTKKTTKQNEKDNKTKDKKQGKYQPYRRMNDTSSMKCPKKGSVTTRSTLSKDSKVDSPHSKGSKASAKYTKGKSSKQKKLKNEHGVPGSCPGPRSECPMMKKEEMQVLDSGAELNTNEQSCIKMLSDPTEKKRKKEISDLRPHRRGIKFTSKNNTDCKRCINCGLTTCDCGTPFCSCAVRQQAASVRPVATVLPSRKRIGSIDRRCG